MHLHADPFLTIIEVLKKTSCPCSLGLYSYSNLLKGQHSDAHSHVPNYVAKKSHHIA